MIRVISIFLALYFPVKESFASNTITGDQFYGEWSTISSVLHPKRQILELASNGGRWIRRDDEGNDVVFTLDEANILIIDDLLTIDYKTPDEKFRLKMILGGWESGKHRKVFGTVYLYSDQGEGLSLYNGIPMSFDSGVEQVPPQPFWSFFSTDTTEQVNQGSISKLEDALKKVKGVSISETEYTKDYSVEKLHTVISISKDEYTSKPFAIGTRPIPNNPKLLEVTAKYEGSGGKFQEYYKAYLEEIESEKLRAQKYIEELVKKIEASK